MKILNISLSLSLKYSSTLKINSGEDRSSSAATKSSTKSLRRSAFNLQHQDRNLRWMHIQHLSHVQYTVCPQAHFQLSILHTEKCLFSVQGAGEWTWR